MIIGQLIGNGLLIELSNAGQTAEVLSIADVRLPTKKSKKKKEHLHEIDLSGDVQANVTVCVYLSSDIQQDKSFPYYDLAYR